MPKHSEDDFDASVEGDAVIIQMDSQILNDPAQQKKIVDAVLKRFGKGKEARIVILPRRGGGGTEEPSNS